MENENSIGPQGPEMDRESKIQEQNQPDPEEKAVVEVLVPISQTGGFLFSNQKELGTAARMAMRMNLCPAHLKKEGIEAVMSALMMVKQFNLPDTAMNEMAYVKGKLTCFGSLVTALAERHPDYRDSEREDFYITDKCEKICVENKNLKTGIPWAHVIRIRKKNSSVWNEYFFSVDDAEQAGLLTNTTKPDSGWIKYTKDLLMHKNKNRALKGNYASALNGINYHEDIVEAIDPSNSREVNPAEQLNNL